MPAVTYWPETSKFTHMFVEYSSEKYLNRFVKKRVKYKEFKLVQLILFIDRFLAKVIYIV